MGLKTLAVRQRHDLGGDVVDGHSARRARAGDSASGGEIRRCGATLRRLALQSGVARAGPRRCRRASRGRPLVGLGSGLRHRRTSRRAMRRRTDARSRFRPAHGIRAAAESEAGRPSRPAAASAAFGSSRRRLRHGFWCQGGRRDLGPGPARQLFRRRLPATDQAIPPFPIRRRGPPPSQRHPILRSTPPFGRSRSRRPDPGRGAGRCPRGQRGLPRREHRKGRQPGARARSGI